MRKTMRRRRTIEAEAIFGRPWLISQAALKALVVSHKTVGPTPDDNQNDYEDDRSYPVTPDGIACIKISGVLTKEPYWGTTAYDEIAEMCSDAMNDPSVKAVLLSINSPGGEVGGMFDLADALYAARAQKPLAAISNDSAFSAAYALASSTERIFSTRVGGTGSIGCVCAHIDYSKMLEADGINVSYVYSGSRKIDGVSTQPLSDLARADLQRECDRIRALFVQMVSRNRNVPETSLMDTEAGCFTAEDGIPLLADEIGTIIDAAAYLRGRIEGVNPRSSRRFISSGLSLHAAQPMIHSSVQPATQSAFSDHIEIDSLYAAAIGAGKPGWADRPLSRDASVILFGKEAPTAILAARCLPTSRASVSSQSSDREITMLVVPYNDSANFGTFREIYAPGCFTGGLSHDLRVLFAHDERFVLGRTSAGTCRFWESANGVHCQVDPVNAQWAEDVLASLHRKDIDQASSSFWILKESWTTRNGDKVRIIEKARMREASIVSFSAYPATTATVGQAELPANSVAALHAKLERQSRIAHLRLDIAKLPHGSVESNKLRMELLRLQ